MKNIFQKRLDQLSLKINDLGYHGFYISNLTNIRYLTGFTGSAGLLLLVDGTGHFFTDGRYTTQSSNQVKNCKIHIIDSSYFDSINQTKLLDSDNLNIAFESTHISHSSYHGLKQNFNYINWHPTNSIIENIAAVKDQDEIDSLKTAIEITDYVFQKIINEIKAGVTEKYISAKISYLFKTNGAEGDSYESIIASGPNSALPHARPTDRKFQKGDFIVMDFGALYKGYHADMTRTIVVGEASDRHHEIYNIVLESQLAGINVARSGMKCSDLDKACRDVIDAKGYGELFMHSTGHGLGLEVHTLPRITWMNHNNLIENNVITIEPGIYIAGWGGVRIEDDCVILKDSCRPMNGSTKDLVVVD